MRLSVVVSGWTAVGLVVLGSVSCTESNPAFVKDGSVGGTRDGPPSFDAITRCDPGAFVGCVAGRLVRCNDQGSGVVTTNCAPFGCNRQRKACNACDPATPPTCTDRKRVSCVDGEQQILECNGGCNNGECSACSKTTYYRDEDQDGYGDPDRGQAACQRPEGYTLDSSDCDDHDRAAHPGQVTFYARQTAGNDDFDFNCDGDEELRWPDLVECYPVQGGQCAGSGWAAAEEPWCGEFAQFVECQRKGGLCVPGVVQTRQQTCH